MMFSSKDKPRAVAIVKVVLVSEPRADESDVDPPVADEPFNEARDRFSDIESAITNAFNTFDRVDNIVTGVVTRTDQAKSLWTTVIGTFWQTAWAVFGFFAGLPREVWIVAAVCVGLLMLLYLYRQIILGKVREEQAHTFEI
jgi:hypothetical protein